MSIHIFYISGCLPTHSFDYFTLLGIPKCLSVVHCYIELPISSTSATTCANGPIGIILATALHHQIYREKVRIIFAVLSAYGGLQSLSGVIISQQY
mmetsp:Transcript_17283/g.34985  ORF Transcript_17283/g.34985 Transcript_17283/m.34985 type:complete len:96 (+) Transcript_17283:1-288(+)